MHDIHIVFDNISHYQPSSDVDLKKIDRKDIFGNKMSYPLSPRRSRSLPDLGMGDPLDPDGILHGFSPSFGRRTVTSVQSQAPEFPG